MTGNMYAVDWNVQGDGVGSIGNAQSALTHEMDQINTDGNTLSAQWESQKAKDAYVTRKKQWDDAAKAISDALTTFKMNLGNSAEIAQTGEDMAFKAASA